MRFVKTACGVLAIGALGLCLNRAIADSPAASQPTSAPTTAAVAITWDQAKDHVGETVTVTGPVKGTHVTTGGKALVLNIGKDYPDTTRLSIMISTNEKNPASADTYKDKTVTVTGKVELYRNSAEIKTKPADVTIDK
jgi:hypothetical protein